MGNMGGVYNKDAIRRIITIQRLEQIISFLEKNQRELMQLLGTWVEEETDSSGLISFNEDQEISNIYEGLIDNGVQILKQHLNSIMSSPYFLKRITAELKSKGGNNGFTHPLPNLTIPEKARTPFIDECVNSINNINFIQPQLPWEKRKILEKLKEVLIEIIEREIHSI